MGFIPNTTQTRGLGPMSKNYETEQLEHKITIFIPIYIYTPM